MPAIDLSVMCIPAECDNIKLHIECEIASRWDAYLLCDICRHFASGGRVIEGFGYEYWDNDKRYVVRRVQGIFPIDDSRFRPH